MMFELQPRVPLQPLLDFLDQMDPDLFVVRSQETNRLTWLCRLAGLNRRSAFRMIHDGSLTVWMADRLVVQGLHLHPCEIWKEEWWSLETQAA